MKIVLSMVLLDVIMIIPNITHAVSCGGGGQSHPAEDKVKEKKLGA